MTQRAHTQYEELQEHNKKKIQNININLVITIRLIAGFVCSYVFSVPFLYIILKPAKETCIQTIVPIH